MVINGLELEKEIVAVTVLPGVGLEVLKATETTLEAACTCQGNAAKQQKTKENRRAAIFLIRLVFTGSSL